MHYFECANGADVTNHCNQFMTNLVATNNSKAIADATSMFNSIKGSASVYNSSLGRRQCGRIIAAVNAQGDVVGLMRLKDEGARMHLMNVVGVPGAGGGQALIDLAKAIAMSLSRPLELEAADADLLEYYGNRNFVVTTGSTMRWAVENRLG